MQTVDIVGIDLGTTKSVIAVWEPKTADRRFRYCRTAKVR